MNAKTVYDEFNLKLVRILPLKDPIFIAALTEQHFFAGNLKEEVIAERTQADATTHFLCKTIEPSLDVGNSEPLGRLLLVMKTFGDQNLKKLAEDIQLRLTPG